MAQCSRHRLDIHSRAQRIALQPDHRQAEQRADQPVEFAQRAIRCLLDRVLHARRVHAVLHLRFIHATDLVKMQRLRCRHHPVEGRLAIEGGQQFFGKTLGQRGFMLIEQAARMRQSLALTPLMRLAFLLAQRAAHMRDEAEHQGTGASHRFGNRGPVKQGVRPGVLGFGDFHGSSGSSGKWFYFSALKRMRLGLAPSSPRRRFLSASYSW